MYFQTLVVTLLLNWYDFLALNVFKSSFLTIVGFSVMTRDESPISYSLALE